MTPTSRGAGSDSIGSDLLDTGRLHLDQLDGLPETVLTHLLRRVVAEALAPSGEPVAAFQSAL
jgi:FXSXX-COOH protein